MGLKVNGVLSVCTGNICRSPYCEHVFRNQLSATAIRCGSAGVGAVIGGKVPDAGQAVARREGVDLSAHRGAQVEQRTLREYDLILVMEAPQKDYLAQRFPESRGRVFLLSHWSGGEDVLDPIGQDEETFELVYAQIDSLVKDWTYRLA